MNNSFRAKLVNVNQIAKNTYETKFEFETDTFVFKAGQYVWVKFPDLLFDDPRGSQRAFSISSSPNIKNSIEIIFRGSGSGYKKTLLDERSIGNWVEIIGPFGFVGVPHTNDSLVFVAGGVGVAPFVSMIRYACESKLENKITLIFSNTSSETAFYSTLFEELANQNPNFKFISNTGKPDVSILKNVDDYKKSLYYVIGPKDFVKGISQEIEALGVDRKNFIFEEFYGFTYSDSKKTQTESQDTELTLKEFQTAVVDVADHIIITDTDGFIRYANPAAEKITGYSLAEMKGNTPRIWGGLMDREFYEKMWKTIKMDKKTFEGEITNRRKNGEIYFAISRISPVLKDGLLTGFVGTEEDITKLKELDKVKDEFLSIASHELRTPLAAIDGIVSMVRDGEYGDVSLDVKGALDDVNIASERMIKLVNDLLSLSRIQAGRLKYILTEVDVSTVVNEVYDLFKPIADKTNLSFKIYNNPSAMVQTDADKTKQVLTNLLNNAFKFTKEGEINISSVVDGNFVKIYVTDTGVGIKEQDQNLLFGKFQQVGKVNSMQQGTGLGLHIAREMIVKLGGEMWLEKSAEGEGSVFAFSIPLKGTDVAQKIKLAIEQETLAHPDQKNN